MSRTTERVIDAVAVGDGAAYPVDRVGAGRDKFAVGDGASDGHREAAEGLTQLLFAGECFASADANGDWDDGGAF